jgi:hypothetical protein
MRMDQYIGLNKWAQERVSQSQVVREVGVRILSNGKVEQFDRTGPVALVVKEVIGHLPGVWKEHVADLHRYTMPNGSVFEEFVQAEPWSGGPCYHIALKNKKGAVVRQSLWTDEELGNA